MNAVAFDHAFFALVLEVDEVLQRGHKEVRFVGIGAGWGEVEWKRIITELSMVGFDGSLSYEHEDVTMSRMDGVEKTAAFLKPLIIKKAYDVENFGEIEQDIKEIFKK